MPLVLFGIVKERQSPIKSGILPAVYVKMETGHTRSRHIINALLNTTVHEIGHGRVMAKDHHAVVLIVDLLNEPQ